MIQYINIREGSGPVETIDEFDTMSEARRCLGEYRMIYNGAGFEGWSVWLSSRCTNDWRNR